MPEMRFRMIARRSDRPTLPLGTLACERTACTARTTPPDRRRIGAAARGVCPPSRALRRPPKKTTVAIALLVVFHLAIYFQFTDPERRMPSFILNLVALADAAFVASVVQFVFDDWRLRRYRLPLPAGRSIGVATLASAVAFLLVATIWFSPWAPIQRDARDDPPRSSPEGH